MSRSRAEKRFFSALCLAGTAVLAGCGSQTAWRDYLNLVRQSYARQAVTIDQAAAIPYASLGYRLDDGNQALLVLATDTNGDLLWTSASRVVLLTRDGRILRTVNFPKDRGATQPLRGAHLPPPADALKAAYQSTRVIDLPAISAYGVRVNCTTRLRGTELITILGTAMSTARVDETCQASEPRWSFTDSYWVDRDNGFVWRSRQHLYPGSMTIQTEVFRPPE
jgi:hypothetical protein